MLELARGVPFGVDVGDFLEFERPFECKRITGAAAEIEHVPAFREVARQTLNLWLEGEGLRHQSRHLDQGMHQRLLLVLGQNPARPAGGHRKTGQDRELTGERLGRGNADFRAG